MIQSAICFCKHQKQKHSGKPKAMVSFIDYEIKMFIAFVKDTNSYAYKTI